MPNYGPICLSQLMTLTLTLVQAGLQLSGEQKQQLRVGHKALLERLSQVAAQRRDTLGQLGLHLLQLPRVHTAIDPNETKYTLVVDALSISYSSF